MAMAVSTTAVAPDRVISDRSTMLLFRQESAACCSTSCRSASPRIFSARQTLINIPGPRFSLCRSGLSFAPSWHGRSHLGDIFRVLQGRQRRCVAGRVDASLFGVGAPEALVIGVVALVVFGPKGLAEVARTLGKSLKAFQPTIQELQQVSREFKNTLEQEIGLDELRSPKPTDVPPTYQQGPPRQQPPPPQNGASEARDGYVGVTQEQAKAIVPEGLRREAEAAAWGASAPPKPSFPEGLIREGEAVKWGSLAPQKPSAEEGKTGDNIEQEKPQNEA